MLTRLKLLSHLQLYSISIKKAIFSFFPDLSGIWKSCWARIELSQLRLLKYLQNNRNTRKSLIINKREMKLLYLEWTYLTCSFKMDKSYLYISNELILLVHLKRIWSYLTCTFEMTLSYLYIWNELILLTVHLKWTNLTCTFEKNLIMGVHLKRTWRYLTCTFETNVVSVSLSVKERNGFCGWSEAFV